MLLSYLEQQVVFEDPLNWFEQVGPQRQRTLQRRLALPKKCRQAFVSHALGQSGNRTAATRKHTQERQGAHLGHWGQTKGQRCDKNLLGVVSAILRVDLKELPLKTEA